MRRLGMVGTLIALAGCSNCNPVERCSEENACQAGAHCVDTYCVLDGTGPSDSGGGAGGGGGTAGGTGGGVNTGGGIGGGSAGGGGGSGGCNISNLAWTTPSGNASKDAGISLELSVQLGLGCQLADFPAVTVIAKQGTTSMVMPSVSPSLPSRYTGNVTLPVDGLWDLTARMTDGGTAVTTVMIDSTSPQLGLDFPPLPGCPGNDGGLTCVDSALPTAYKRNQEIQVKLRSTEALKAKELRIYSVASDGGYDVLAPEVCTVFCDAGECSCYGLKLWKPVMNAYRGSMKVSFTATDLLGNPASLTGNVDVTRFNWSKALSDSNQVKATPAIGKDGTLFAGTNAVTSGNLYAIAADGRENWVLSAGGIEASPAVSPADAGTELVFFGSNAANDIAILKSVKAVDHTGGVTCIGQPNASVTSSPTVFFTPTNTSTPASAAFMVGAGTLRVIRDTNCIDQPAFNAGQVPHPGNLTSSGKLVTFADDSPRLQGFDYEVFGMGAVPAMIQRNDGGWTYPNIGAVSGGQVSALANGTLIGARPSGGLQNTLYRAITGATLSVDWSLQLNQGATGPVIADGGSIWVGVDAQLQQFSSDGGSLTSAAAVIGKHVASPVLGEGNRIFAVVNTVGNTPQLHSWSRTSPPTLEWSINLVPTGAQFFASPTLDCSRDINGAKQSGRAGVLYAVTSTGTVYSVIVDSQGLDTSAPWPKYQRDPRNSGNTDTSLQEFDCR